MFRLSDKDCLGMHPGLGVLCTCIYLHPRCRLLFFISIRVTFDSHEREISYFGLLDYQTAELGRTFWGEKIHHYQFKKMVEERGSVFLQNFGYTRTGIQSVLSYRTKTWISAVLTPNLDL